jgi:hypothetical protein
VGIAGFGGVQFRKRQKNYFNQILVLSRNFYTEIDYNYGTKDADLERNCAQCTEHPPGSQFRLYLAGKCWLGLVCMHHTVQLKNKHTQGA